MQSDPSNRALIIIGSTIVGLCYIFTSGVFWLVSPEQSFFRWQSTVLFLGTMFVAGVWYYLSETIKFYSKKRKVMEIIKEHKEKGYYRVDSSKKFSCDEMRVILSSKKRLSSSEKQLYEEVLSALKHWKWNEVEQ